MKYLYTLSLILSCSLLAAETPRLQVLPGQRILLKGDSITRGYGFGNYTDPSPLRTIPGIASIFLKDNLAKAPTFDSLPNIWQGLNPDGTPKTVDTLAAEIDANIKAGSV